MESPEFVILVVSDHYWGRGATVEEAIAVAACNGGKRVVKGYRIYVAPPGVRVDGYGRMVWTGFQPRLIYGGE